MTDKLPLNGFAPGVPTQDKADMFNERQFAAWVFAVGTPDSRPGHETDFQPPLLPAQCWQAMSVVLWKLGFRHIPAKQTHWVIPGNNWVPGRLVDKKPEPQELDLETVAEFFKETNPEIYDKVITATPEELAPRANEMLQKLQEIGNKSATLKGQLPETSTENEPT